LRLGCRGVRVAVGQVTREETTPMAAERQAAIVTGAASGIGRAMTLGLLQGGIDVAAVDKEAALARRAQGGSRRKSVWRRITDDASRSR
jgi:NAD(P)-dependent dehydrogenase (short-subunit alcohol dehydrogenase family)